jgi:hypothetical protein
VNARTRTDPVSTTARIGPMSRPWFG